jgi:hypothetical protein
MGEIANEEEDGGNTCRTNFNVGFLLVTLLYSDNWAVALLAYYYWRPNGSQFLSRTEYRVATSAYWTPYPVAKV